MRERDHSSEEIIQPVASGVGGGQVLVPRTEPISDGEPHVKGEVPGSEQDSDGFEGDEDLANSASSAEFEHLRKPPILPDRKPETKS